MTEEQLNAKVLALQHVEPRDHSLHTAEVGRSSRPTPTRSEAVSDAAAWRDLNDRTTVGTTPPTTLRSSLADRRIGFAGEWCALVAATVTLVLFHPHPVGSVRLVVIGMLALGMGIQNAMIRRWGVPDLATNVMTLTVTGLVAEWSLVGGDNQHAERRATSLGLFAVSAVLGAYLTRFGVEFHQETDAFES